MRLIEDNRGYALLIILWTLVILGVIFSSLVDETYLSTLLVKNSLDNKRVDQALVSGVMLGIEQLLSDKTDYDTVEDQWLEVMQSELDNIQYQVEIKDVGSRLNINYLPYGSLEYFDWWDKKKEKEFKELIKEEGLIYQLSMLESIIGDEYDQASEYLTINGKFNINTGNLVMFQKLTDSLGLDPVERDKIIGYLVEKRRINQIIESVDDLEILYRKRGLLPESLDLVRSYLVAKGDININLVKEENLESILNRIFNSNSKKAQRYTEEIIDYRRKEEIKELSQLKLFLTGINLKRFSQYFSTFSKYFLIKSTILNGNDYQSEVSAVIERYQDDLKNWRVRIIQWNKNYNWKRGG